MWLVPTSVDTKVWKPAAREPDGKWTIGWTGTWSNLSFLYQLEQVLADFLNEHPGSRLLIVCDRKPSFQKLRPAAWEFAQWSMAREVALVQRMNVGLMPLVDSEFARAKCGFKMLSYMAVGLPVIVSPIGVNEEILTRGDLGFAARSNEEWYRALERLYEDQQSARQMGVTGRAVVDKHYSVKTNVRKLADIFRQLAES